MEKIGLIAGRGNFPLAFAREAKEKGYSVLAVAVKANTPRRLKQYVDKIQWLSVTELNRVADVFLSQDIHKVAMAGQINPYSLFNRKVMSDPAVQDFFGKIDDRRADTIFRAFVNRLESRGLVMLSSTLVLDRYLPGCAILSVRKPSSQDEKDINLGFRAAKHLGAIDIGQSVCVKNGVILAVEAIEGTDNTIRRAAALAKEGIVLIKVSKPLQDIRFDVPVVGLGTIRNLPAGSCLAIEAKRTLFLDQRDSLKLANQKGIAIVSRKAVEGTP